MAELCQMFMQPMAIMFAGRLGTVQLDAVALANSVRILVYIYAIFTSLHLMF